MGHGVVHDDMKWLVMNFINIRCSRRRAAVPL